MSKTKEAPADAGTSVEAMLAGTDQATIHQENNSTQHGQISRFLMRGEENAISTAALLKMMNFKSSRQLQQEIEAERKRGIPILTKPGSDGGYFLPSEDPAAAMQECRNFVHFMHAKGLGCIRSMRPAAKLLADLQREAGGQERMVL